MGAVWSRGSSEPEPTESQIFDESETASNNIDGSERKRLLDEELKNFKAEMLKKREARHEAIKALNGRISTLEKEKETALAENSRLRDELDRMKNEGETEPAPAECEETVDFEDEESNKDEIIDGLNRQVKALKDVAKIGGEMLRIRELQVNELKSKLVAIEETGVAYEKEVENMKKLRNLYEERARAMKISHQMELEREKSKLLAAEMRQKIAEHRVSEVEEKSRELEEKMTKLDSSLDDAKSQISELKIKLAGKNEDLYNATSQMAVVNHLFGQLLSPGQDSLEKITKVLQEHHDLVNHLTANGSINDLASTLVEIADKDPLPFSEDQDNDISGHLSKVWRLLVELLGHHISKPVAPEEETPESCYKSVETPSGPKLVISVSQTFLRLKDLILEKNSLMKEVGRLKDLNSTLETRLLEQETRLSVVAGELCTTWNVVNKLKKQHANLHTNEQVLRYELAQKRLLLTELKKKLEECKENWSLARLKNSQTEKDWKLLRTEFALRKQQASSAESGYEESPTDSQDEEDNWKDDKIEKKSVSSDEEDHCAVLAWNDSGVQRVERRGTLTDANLSSQESSKISSFRIDHQVDSCIVLPWTEVPDADSSEPVHHVPSDSARASCSDSNLAILNVSEVSSTISSTPVDEARLSDSSVVTPSISSEDISDTTVSAHHASSPCVDRDECVPSVVPNEFSSRLSDENGASESSSQPRERTAEEILQARQDRLRRLEEGCQGLFNRMSRTNQRSEMINSRLTELHEIYGEDRSPRRLQEGDISETCTSIESNSPSGSSSTEISQPPTPPPFPETPLYLPRTQNSSLSSGNQ